jgi:hypothetical protein
MPKFPEPPNPLAVAPEIILSSRLGRTWWRVYFAGGAHPTAWDECRYYGPTTSRFDHHDVPARIQSKGILYAARDPRVCLAEAFQETRLIDRTGRQPWLVAFELTRDVSLLDLTGVWPTLAGASMAIHSGQRPRAGRWSRAIHAAYPDVEGLLYCSSMYKNAHSLALYERAKSALSLAPVFHRALNDPALQSVIDAAAVEIGYGLV